MFIAALPVVRPSGSPPAFGNFYVIFWSLLNFLILIAIVAFVIWLFKYFKKQSDYKKQLLDKLDSLILLLQNKETDK